jgi:integral membrane protein
LFGTKKNQFRLIANIEGWSFLILLFIAMPLKYILGIAIATKIVGMTHGALWVGYLWLQFEASKEENWGIKFNILAFFMALTPFGTMYLNKRLKEMD